MVSDDSDNEDLPSHASSGEIVRHNSPSQKMQCSDKQQDAKDKVEGYPLCVLIYNNQTVFLFPYSSSLNQVIARLKLIHTSMF